MRIPHESPPSAKDENGVPMLMWIAGPVTCRWCLGVWVAVRPQAATYLRCPACGRYSDGFAMRALYARDPDKRDATHPHHHYPMEGIHCEGW